MEDIDVCTGAHQNAFKALEKAFRGGSQRKADNRPLPGTLDDDSKKRFSLSDELALASSPTKRLSRTYVEESDVEGVNGHDESSGDRATTPPELDGGLSSPATPDSSPPTTTENLPARSMEQKEKPQFLHPMFQNTVPAHVLREYPSSRADSFQTAREDQSLTSPSVDEHNMTLSPVHLPEDDKLPQHWLDSTRELRIASIGIGDITDGAIETPRFVEEDLQSITPKSSRRRSKHESPPRYARQDSDWEKHISYVSGPDEIDVARNEQEVAEKGEPAETPEPAAGLGLGLTPKDFSTGRQRVAYRMKTKLQNGVIIDPGNTESRTGQGSYVNGQDEIAGPYQEQEGFAMPEPTTSIGLGLSSKDSPLGAKQVGPRVRLRGPNEVHNLPRDSALNGDDRKPPSTPPPDDLKRSAEDVNNLLYKQLREESAKRHSAISSTSGAIPVGIHVPATLDTPPRKLKRQAKCQSLRGDTSSDSKRGSLDSGAEKMLPLKHKRVHLPETNKSLEASPVSRSTSKARQVSSPARLSALGADANNMTALTFASLQDSPSAKRISKFEPADEHKLRRLPNGDRNRQLQSNNKSLEASPVMESNARQVPLAHRLSGLGTDANNMTALTYASLQNSPHMNKASKRTISETEYKLRSSSAGDRLTNNIGVKRSSSNATRNFTDPTRRTEKSEPKVRGVIPSVGSDPESPNTRLRRFSREVRLENNDNIRRTSLDRGGQLSQQPSNDFGIRRLSADKGSVLSSPRKSLDARFLQPTSTTPLSTSAFSDRTDIEVLEASGVRIYPHNNESLLLVQQGSRPESKHKDETDVPDFFSGMADQKFGLKQLEQPIFSAQVDPPTPVLGSSQPNQVDSPLTNPRQAPVPPVIQFIPPTPNKELEREVFEGGEREQQGGTFRGEESLPQRRLTLLQRARRYSDSLFARTGSLRRPRNPSRETEQRDVFLSPLWRPQGFWDDFDSDSEADFEAGGTLPPGGDTSNIGEAGDDGRRRTSLPRAMSKRMPGFRGRGGFLVGNSLGLDRHGTNNRRHYVSTGSRTLSKRASEELIRKLSSGKTADGIPRRSLSTKTAPAPRMSQESLHRMRGFAVPFSGGIRAQWVGTQRFRARMRTIRLAKEEREKEQRRDKLRQSIGYRLYHDDGR